MILRYYKIQCDYCNCLIFSNMNRRPSNKTIRAHCKLIIRNGKTLTFHHECYDKIKNSEYPINISNYGN